MYSVFSRKTRLITRRKEFPSQDPKRPVGIVKTIATRDILAVWRASKIEIVGLNGNVSFFVRSENVSFFFKSNQDTWGHLRADKRWQ